MNETLKEKRKFGLSATSIKLFALFAMTLDHIAWLLTDPQIVSRNLTAYPEIASSYYLAAYPSLYWVSYPFHIIGRLAFPLFVFFAVEGVHHTRNIKRYMLTVFGFAVISEIPFNLLYAKKLFCPDGQNVMFTLLLCIIAVYAFNKLRGKKIVIAIAVAAVCALAAYYLKVDYGFKAVIVACIIELLYKKKALGFSLGCIFLGLFKPWEFCALAAVPLILLYNGERGAKLKYIFYLYYPLHICAIYAISRFCIN